MGWEVTHPDLLVPQPLPGNGHPEQLWAEQGEGLRGVVTETTLSKLFPH